MGSFGDTNYFAVVASSESDVAVGEVVHSITTAEEFVNSFAIVIEEEEETGEEGTTTVTKSLTKYPKEGEEVTITVRFLEPTVDGVITADDFINIKGEFVRNLLQ